MHALEKRAWWLSVSRLFECQFGDAKKFALEIKKFVCRSICRVREEMENSDGGRSLELYLCVLHDAENGGCYTKQSAFAQKPEFKRRHFNSLNISIFGELSLVPSALNEMQHFFTSSSALAQLS